MFDFRIFATLLALVLLGALLPERVAAQQQESVPITYTQYIRHNPIGVGCSWVTVGSHADPVGNGRDGDYHYPFDTGSVYVDGYDVPTVPEWTGVSEDIPGERITFTNWGGGGSCDALPDFEFIPDDPNAYYTPPPNKPPTACFTTDEADELLTIDFDASCSTDEDGTVVSYTWDFGGDGTGGGGGAQTSFTYDEGGEYEVTLTVRDNDGDDDETDRSVTVEGPDLHYAVSLKRYETESAGKRAQDDDAALQVGDSVLVRIAVENTGDLPLEAIRVPGGEVIIEVTSEPEDALVFLSAERAEIGRLEPGSSDTLAYLYKAAHAVEEATVLVSEVAAEAVNPATDARTAYSESESTCVLEDTDGGKWTGPGGLFVQDDEENNACATFSVDPAPFVVNSTEDRELDPDVDPEEDGCTTGESVDRDGQPEPECTLRAAMQIAASMTSAATIEFDIPGGGDVHTIVLDGEALPAISVPLTLSGASQPDGVPIEIDGSALSGGIGFDLGGDETTVEALAFYGFPGTVLALRGDGSVLSSSYLGSDWVQSYTSTDATVTDALRNGGTAVLVTGDEARIGGVGGEGNLIIGSTIGIRVEGAADVEILGNDIGILESPHAEHGIDLSDADRVRVGTPEAPNRINYNLEYGIRVDEATSGALIRNNEIIRSRKDGILINQGSAAGEPVVIGGEEEGEGNTIERSIGAGIRVTGSGGSAGGDPALLIQGNTLKENEEIGIRLEGGSAVQIGGATGEPGSGAGNTIEDGIRLEPGNGARVQGNRLSHLDLETGYSDESEVVYVSGANNRIGGETPAEGNVIYGVPEPGDQPDDQSTPPEEDAFGFGIADEGTETTIQHNHVGTEGALFNGVILRGTNAQVIENTISGNQNVGLWVQSTATIEGNYIGATPTGNGALPNGGPGVVLWTKATLGGAKDGDACKRPCNVISGNAGPGVLVRAEATGATIQGNMIGVGADGLTAVGNGASGILVLADDVTIGGENDIELGDCTGPCNIIAANGGDGIRNFEAEEYSNLSSGGTASTLGAGTNGASGLVVEGNFIGTTIPGSGNTGTGNAGSGIALGALGSNNRVGDTGRRGNLISGNGGAGVLVLASSEAIYLRGTDWQGGTGNRIRGNRIHDNGGIAIDLYPNYVLPGGDGWTDLDMGDADDGPNTMINWPYLIESGNGDGASGQHTLLVLWTGDPGTMAGTYALDIYTSASCRGATAEAGNFLISRDITFPIGGVANIDAARVDVPFVPSMPYYVATFTDSDGNTSELGNCRRAGQRPEQALQDVDPGIRTLINRLLIQLDEGGGAGGKTAATQSLMVLRSEATPGGDRFEATAALSPGGQPVVPRSTQGAYWEVVTPRASGPMQYDVCLDATDAGATEDLLVLGRGGATNGAWRPFDTRIETIDGLTYACADDLSLMHLTLGSGEEAALAVPALLTPENGVEEVDLSTVELSWQALSEAATYDVQVSLRADFGALLDSTSGLAATSYVPATLARRVRHYWRVRGVTAGGEAGPWSVPFRFSTTETSVAVEDEAGVPETFVLSQNYPNPFNPQTTIGFALPQAAEVRLVVFDVLGREVARLVERTLAAGRHEVIFDASGLPSGVYLYRLEADGFVQVRRMLLVK